LQHSNKFIKITKEKNKITSWRIRSKLKEINRVYNNCLIKNLIKKTNQEDKTMVKEKEHCASRQQKQLLNSK